MAYLDRLGESWGELCGSPETASEWADRLMGGLVREWESERGRRVWFRGTSHCLSALVAAGRYDELLELLERAPFDTWMYRQFGMQALVAQGRKAEAIKYAEAGRGRNDNPAAVARQCEALLLSMGLTEEAYRRYGIAANPGSTYLATFRAVRRKYPHKAAGEILADLVATTPGKEGKWFAAAKDAGLYDEAVALATRAPSDPKTLARAARDFAASEPEFAVSAGLLALHWLVEGYGYEITGSDVWAVYRSTMAAADRLGTTEAVRGRVRAMVAAEATRDRFVAKALGRELGL
jgi:hypothetical protein